MQSNTVDVVIKGVNINSYCRWFIEKIWFDRHSSRCYFQFDKRKKHRRGVDSTRGQATGTSRIQMFEIRIEEVSLSVFRSYSFKS